MPDEQSATERVQALIGCPHEWTVEHVPHKDGHAECFDVDSYWACSHDCGEIDRPRTTAFGDVITERDELPVPAPDCSTFGGAVRAAKQLALRVTFDIGAKSKVTIVSKTIAMEPPSSVIDFDQTDEQIADVINTTTLRAINNG